MVLLAEQHTALFLMRIFNPVRSSAGKMTCDVIRGAILHRLAIRPSLGDVRRTLDICRDEGSLVWGMGSLARTYQL